MEFSCYSVSVWFDDIPFEIDAHDVIYIEKWYDEPTNEFIQSNFNIIRQHFENNGFHFLYMPRLSESLKEDVISKYFVPRGDFILKGVSIDSSFMLNFLSKNNTNTNIVHGPALLYDMSVKPIIKAGENDAQPIQYVFRITGLEPETFYFKNSNLSSVLGWIELDIFEGKQIENGTFDYDADDDILDEEDFSNNEDDFFNDNDDVINMRKDVEEKVRQMNSIVGRKDYRINLESVSPKDFELSRLVVTKDYRIILPDYENMEIDLGPQQKAIYLFFLNNNNSEGYMYSDFVRNEEELLYWYDMGLQAKYGKSSTDKKEQFRLLINNKRINKSKNEKKEVFQDNSERFRTIVSLINQKFVEKLIFRPSDQYIIPKGDGPKSISLPRELVKWECRRPKFEIKPQKEKSDFINDVYLK